MLAPDETCHISSGNRVANAVEIPPAVAAAAACSWSSIAHTAVIESLSASSASSEAFSALAAMTAPFAPASFTNCKSSSLPTASRRTTGHGPA
eukprot:3172650-Rhodomonas_salina.2